MLWETKGEYGVVQREGHLQTVAKILPGRLLRRRGIE